MQANRDALQTLVAKLDTMEHLLRQLVGVADNSSISNSAHPESQRPPSPSHPPGPPPISASATALVGARPSSTFEPLKDSGDQRRLSQLEFHLSMPMITSSPRVGSTDRLAHQHGRPHLETRGSFDALHHGYIPHMDDSSEGDVLES